METQVFSLLVGLIFSNLILKGHEKPHSDMIFQQSYSFINSILIGGVSMNFKDAVWTTECAYDEGLL